MTLPGTLQSPVRLQIAAISERGITALSTGVDKEAQSAVERMGERQQIKRPEARG